VGEDRIQRRLAAILAADVVGYSRLIEADEEGTRARLRSLHAELIDPRIAANGGRIVKMMGDGILAEFPSAVDAVRNALEIQEAVRRRNADVPNETRIEFRVGINVGDVIVEGDDIHGDGVIVASRLEGLCGPGEVYVSGTVYDQAAGKLAASFADLGEQTVKNINKPVRVYQTWAQLGESPHTTDIAQLLLLPDKPSIAVLPFVNMSGDSEQEFFADGMTEDIITGLSRFRSLFVIARNSTFGYKGKSPDVREVARDLGVRYILEGSVRRGGELIRITGQLIDAETGNHLWAERYERAFEDVFAVQDEVTEAIVAAIAPEIDEVERARAQRKPPDNLDAWGLYQRGLAAYRRSTTGKEIEWAIEQFDRVCESDPTFALAFAWAASARTRYVLLFDPENPSELLNQAKEMAARGITLDSRDATCLWADGYVQNMLGRHDMAISRSEEAISLNPSDAMARYTFAMALGSAGRLDEAIPHIDHAIRLSPRDVAIAGFQTYRAFVLFDLERYEEAIEWARRASRSPNPLSVSFEVVTAALIQLERQEEAGVALNDLLAHTPGASLGQIRERPWIGRPETMERYLDALREAGLPE
jgi:adenylate cyclase